MAFTDLRRGGAEKRKRKCVECEKDLPKHGDECVKQAEGGKCVLCGAKEFARRRRGEK